MPRMLSLLVLVKAFVDVAAHGRERAALVLGNSSASHAEERAAPLTTGGGADHVLAATSVKSTHVHERFVRSAVGQHADRMDALPPSAQERLSQSLVSHVAAPAREHVSEPAASRPSDHVAARAPPKQELATPVSLARQGTSRSESLRGRARHGQVPTATVMVVDDRFAKVAFQAFSVVSVAELFDKTWFVALVYSLQYGPKIAFLGSSIGLALHVAVAAGLGAVISRFFAIWALHLATALTFSVLAALYAHEYYTTDGEEDALENRSEEAKQDIAALGAGPLSSKKSWISMLWQVFIAVFIAEWGDRTQIAMITLHSSLPLLPVCLGSLVAFVVLSASAAMVAQLLQGRRLSERMICGVSAVSFFVFAALAFADCAQALRVRDVAWAAFPM